MVLFYVKLILFLKTVDVDSMHGMDDMDYGPNG